MIFPIKENKVLEGKKINVSEIKINSYSRRIAISSNTETVINFPYLINEVYFPIFPGN